jgi:hypothetical protein
MTMRLLNNATQALICNYLPQLPPVVSDWQQSCLQPRCPHYCQGGCWNPGRQAASASCPFEGKELPLEDADTGEDSPSRATRGVPKKG